MRYVDGELSEAELKEFNAHMEICPSCIDYLASYKTCIELGKSYKECSENESIDEVPPALLDAILKAKKKADTEPTS
jgi:anti-sigma factor RsiW